MTSSGFYPHSGFFSATLDKKIFENILLLKKTPRSWPKTNDPDHSGEVYQSVKLFIDFQSSKD